MDENEYFGIKKRKLNGKMESFIIWDNLTHREVGERRGAEGERLGLRESDGFVSLL